MTDAEAVRDSAQHFRRQLELHRDRHVSLTMFPAGACDTASLVLARWLDGGAGLGAWEHVTGTAADGATHVWLEQGSLLVDITADQFDDIEDQVIVTTDRSWHYR